MRSPLALLAVLFLLALPALADDAEKELAKLKGSWTVTAFEDSGKKIVSDKAPTKFTFTDSELVVTAKLGDMKLGLEVKPDKKPKGLVLTMSEDAQKAQMLGIYQLDGDKLKVCWQDAELGAPKDFATNAKTKGMCFTLKRAK